jgi:hypothetical protein
MPVDVLCPDDWGLQVAPVAMEVGTPSPVPDAKTTLPDPPYGQQISSCISPAIEEVIS